MTRSTEKYSPLSEETVLKLKEKHLQAAQQSNDILSWAQKEYDLLTDVEVPEEDSKQFYLFLDGLRGCINYRKMTIKMKNETSYLLKTIMYLILWMNSVDGKTTCIELIARCKSFESELTKILRKANMNLSTSIRDRFGIKGIIFNDASEEEIEEMLSSNKQVFMYFLDAPVNPSSVDMEQYKKVQAFKEKYKDRGIYFIVRDEQELRQLFTNHLGMHFLPLAVGGKNSFEKKASPVLKIKAASQQEDKDAIVEYSEFSE